MDQRVEPSDIERTLLFDGSLGTLVISAGGFVGKVHKCVYSLTRTRIRGERQNNEFRFNFLLLRERDVN